MPAGVANLYAAGGPTSPHAHAAAP
jgi:hypothetical protein